MKVRTGFVSNSSSSSFLVAYNEDSALYVEKNEEKNVVLTFEEFLHFVEDKGYNAYCSERTELVADGFENVKDWIVDDGWRDSEFVSHLMNEVTEALKNYKNVAVIRIEYSDKISRRMLDLFVKLADVKMLNSEDE